MSCFCICIRDVTKMNDICMSSKCYKTWHMYIKYCNFVNNVSSIQKLCMHVLLHFFKYYGKLNLVGTLSKQTIVNKSGIIFEICWNTDDLTKMSDILMSWKCYEMWHNCVFTISFVFF